LFAFRLLLFYHSPAPSLRKLLRALIAQAKAHCDRLIGECNAPKTQEASMDSDDGWPGASYIEQQQEHENTDSTEPNTPEQALFT